MAAEEPYKTKQVGKSITAECRVECLCLFESRCKGSRFTRE